MTPTEVLLSYAKLELPAGTPPNRLTRRVAQILEMLGLESCADVVIQDAADNKGGISGGQLRRLAVAVALLKQPSVLILDEPTSGLDARSSLEVMSILSHLSRQGYTVIASIHQPRREIFEMFTDVLLLAKG
ncbi:P-loop containing nucleoside triphosphate hydrolase protein, partial [Entophlyctis helioformis]